MQSKDNKRVNIPEISVIVPVYKVESYLRQCVDSILGQIFQDFELILVDDGSPDGCPAICDEYAAQDRRVRVIHQKNGGLSAARNAGLDCAKGEYIAFIDSDDWVHSEYLERLLNALTCNHADMAICDLELYHEATSSGARTSNSPIRRETLTSEDLMVRLYLDQSWYYVVAWNKLYRREIFRNIRFPVGFINEDEAVFHRVLANCRAIISLDDKLYYYRQHGESIMGSAFSIKRTDNLSALSDRICFSHEMGWSDLMEATITRYTFHALEYYYLFPKTEENRPYFIRMNRSLRAALPHILHSTHVNFRQKFYLCLIWLSPRLYAHLRKWRHHE